MTIIDGYPSFDDDQFREAVESELRHVRSLGASRNLVLATSNLGAFEALLIILSHQETGLPVYRALDGIRSTYASKSGVLKRLRLLRDAGLIEARTGDKRKSEVLLCASKELVEELGPILVAKYQGGL